MASDEWIATQELQWKKRKVGQQPYRFVLQQKWNNMVGTHLEWKSEWRDVPQDAEAEVIEEKKQQCYHEALL